MSNEYSLKRVAYLLLLQWKRESGGTLAILVEGGRRVGNLTYVPLYMAMCH